MRVLQIASGDLWAGAEVQTYILATELAKRPDIEVRAAVMNEGELARRLRASDIPVQVIDETKLAAPAIIRALRELMRSFKPQIVHTHRTKENLLGWIANVASTRAPMVRTIHGANEHPASWIRQPFRRLVQAVDDASGKYLVDHVIAVSAALGDTLRASHGYRNVTVVPNGIDAEHLRRMQIRPPFATDGENIRHVGLVGRLEPVKRGDLFVGMAAALAGRKFPFELRFHIFGDGSQRAELETLSKQLGVESLVHFHGHTPQVARWLGSLDALVLCSDHEGLPMVLLEAIATGTPVVAHAVGGLTEVMRDNLGGILVTRHNVGSYATALERVLLDPDCARVAEARQLLMETYSASKNAERVACLYRRSLGQ